MSKDIAKPAVAHVLREIPWILLQSPLGALMTGLYPEGMASA